MSVIAKVIGVSFAGMLVARPARAVECRDLPAPVYGIGGSATKPLLAKVAESLAALPTPQTVVYQAPGACLGIDAIIAGTKTIGTASYWTASGIEQTCTLREAGDDVQFATAVHTADLCGRALPATIADVLGPVVTFNLLVPITSTERAISADAAYFVFGFGAAGGVAPWIDDAQILRREPTSAAQLFVGLATGVPATKFKGYDASTSMVTRLAGSALPNAAIGFASGDVADVSRDRLRSLAFRARGQSCGYWPDSTPETFDKRSLRTGLYWIWSNVHFFTPLDGDKKPRFPAARTLIGYLADDTEPPAGANVLELEIQSGAVPMCAMEVARSGDLGPLESYAPARPCGCYFEHVAMGTTTCSACTNDASCAAGAPHCRHGFCEVN